MTAVEPWSGHFDINGPIYISGMTKINFFEN